MTGSRTAAGRLGRDLARWTALAGLGVAGLAVVAPASAQPCAVRQMYVGAHEDDPILFQSPDLLHAVRAGACVTAVYVTAGDAGRSTAYWHGRERGALAAFADMARAPDRWVRRTTSAAGHSIVTYTLAGRPNLTQVFLRLPDGGRRGTGSRAHRYESLQKLWTGAIRTMHPVDGRKGYTSTGLTRTLAALMTRFRPSRVMAHDYVGTFGGGDNSDHYGSAYFTRAAHRRYLTPHVLTGYLGYPSSARRRNVFGADLAAKRRAFYAYGAHDPAVCGSSAECAGTRLAGWLRRQYVVGSERGP